jgi:hypothetical protein
MFKVNSDQTCDFAEHWRTKDGLFVAVAPEAINFATDWANICIASFIEYIAAARAKKTAEAAEPPKSSITLTGADS